jgi:hypothetical protein
VPGDGGVQSTSTVQYVNVDLEACTKVKVRITHSPAEGILLVLLWDEPSGLGPMVQYLDS